MVAATSLEQEREEQRCWRLRPEHAELQVFDRLLVNEFQDPAVLARQQDAALAGLLAFAAAEVPYYGALFEARRLPARPREGRAALRRLPLLGKRELQENLAALRARRLPEGHRLYAWSSSSGTTGRPARVLHAVESNAMYNFLEQRQLRWFRWDPMGLRADIRIATQFPHVKGTPRPAAGSHFRAERWRYVGHFFETGDYAGICVTAPLDQQLAWLRDLHPDFLMAYPSTLERLAYQLGPAAGALGLRGLYAISEQMAAVMRRRIEGSFGLPVDQTYGFNEIGKVAQRCRAGRYHVNVEHCVVEILDAEGAACKAGQTGRIVVTALRNPAMPLLRYDSGDLAEAVDGPCPCGRTLPSFGPIAGRYRRMALTPEGTSLQVFVLKKSLESMPPEINANLRQYQIRQRSDGSYVILLRVAGPLPPAFEAWLRRSWEEELTGARPALALEEVEAIPLSPSGKVEDFISDYAAARAAAGEDG